jgi:hypothetical protein
MWLLWLTRGYAQDFLPPPVNAANACGQLCDFVTPIAYGTPAISLLLALGLVLALHVKSTQDAAEEWSGKPVTWVSVWLIPMIVALVSWVVVNAVPMLLAILYPDFRMLLISEATQLLYGLWLATTVLVGVAGPALIAAFFSDRASSSST